MLEPRCGESPQVRYLRGGRRSNASPLPDRYAEKRGKGWTGYKVHISETCQSPDAAGRRPAPDLITNTETTLAPVTDAEMTEPVHDALARRGLRPGEHAADTGYASADLLLAARARGITLLAPVLPDSSPQARSGGYTADMFAIDWENKQVTCPQGAGQQFLDPGPQQGNQHHHRPVRQGDLRTVPGPGPVHHRGPLRPPARLPPPPGPRGPHRRPRRAGQRRTGGAGTGSAPGSRAPSPRPPTSPASAAPATSAWAKPAWNTTPPPPPST